MDMLNMQWLPSYSGQNGEYVPRPMLEPIMEESTDDDDGDTTADDNTSEEEEESDDANENDNEEAEEEVDDEEEESSASSVLTAPDTSSWAGGETGRSGSETGSVIRVEFATGTHCTIKGSDYRCILTHLNPTQIRTTSPNANTNVPPNAVATATNYHRPQTPADAISSSTTATTTRSCCGIRTNRSC